MSENRLPCHTACLRAALASPSLSTYKHARMFAQELQDLHSSAEVRDLGVRVGINEADITDISAELDGPPGRHTSLPA